MTDELYTTRLQAGLGMLDETRTLLELWDDGMSVSALQRAALESGHFPTMTARRVRNVVNECFGPRYLHDKGRTAALLKRLSGALSSREMNQIFFIHTCRANVILADFVREVHWSAYSAGRETLSIVDAKDFVARANEMGRTRKAWSDSTKKRVASYLTGACADFGLLDNASHANRRIMPMRIEARVACYLAYDLHFRGLGDNRLISDMDWGLFGMDKSDVLEELKKLTLRGWLIVQTAGDVTRIGWEYKRMEDVADAITQG